MELRLISSSDFKSGGKYNIGSRLGQDGISPDETKKLITEYLNGTTTYSCSIQSISQRSHSYKASAEAIMPKINLRYSKILMTN